MRIQLLGNFCLFIDERPHQALDKPRLQALIAYLVLHRATPQPRQHIAFLFWPDTTEKQAQTNLRNLLHLLRKALPQAERCLDITVQSVQWRADAPYRLDAADFEDAIAQAAHAHEVPARIQALCSAAEIYGGDLLTTHYDEWIIAERSRYQQHFIAGVDQLVHLLMEGQEFTLALKYAQRLLEADPLREESYRLLMRLHAANQERASALHLYHRCVSLLERELDSEPSPLTQALYAELLHPAATESIPTPPSNMSGAVNIGAVAVQPAFIGRQSERQILAAAWSRATKGEAHLVLIRGEAGIGKTRLTEEFLTSVGRAGHPTARARAYMTTGTLAYAPLVEWLQAPALGAALRQLDPIWLSELARLLPELLVERPQLPPPQPLTAGWQRQRLFDAITHALLSLGQPLLLFFDDLQWAEQEMLDYLHYLLMRYPQSPFLIVAAAQPEALDEAHPVFRWQGVLARHGRLTEVELGLLNFDETAELSAAVSAHPPDRALLEEIFQETAGHPLFVIETMRARLLAEPGHEETRPKGEIEDATLAAAVRAIIQTRLAQLRPETRELLAVAAVVGREFTFDLLMAASHLDESTLIRRLDELWRCRIIREDGADAYDFVHGKVREVAYAGLGAVQRKQIHRHVAETLEQLQGANKRSLSGQLAFHYEYGGVPARAVHYYRMAAETEEQLYANAEAIRHYRNAIRLWSIAFVTDGLAPEERALGLIHLHERVGDLWAISGEMQATRAGYQQAIELLPAGEVVRRATLVSKLGHAWEGDYHYDQALTCYTQAEALLQQQPTQDEAWWQSWLQNQLERMWAYYWLNRYQDAEQLVQQIAPIIERAATTSQQINFCMARFSNSCRRHRYREMSEAVAHCRHALEISLAWGDAGHIAWSRFGLGFSLLWKGDLEEAETQIVAALEIARQRGDLVHRSRCLTYLTVIHRRCAEVSETELLAQRTMQMAESAHQTEYVAMAYANLAWVAWQRGNLEESERDTLRALSAWAMLPKEHGSCAFQWLALTLLLALRLSRHDLAGAIECARGLLEPSQLQLPTLLETRLAHAISAWEAGQAEAAHSHLVVAQELAQRLGYL